jgi:hypothetical protein
MKRKRVFSVAAMICIVATMALPLTLSATCEYKVGDVCEFKCDNTPNETCKGEATIDGRKIRVTCDGKESLCSEGGITVL